ncbi:hypothetical protein TrST_g7252 [Triparma strigata]|uniref:DNA helicase n=1 Tax=Triparma strigata TaxID=1606541 RepID=A0A9W7EW92_9STRA|nr:hypothetical protein TrST_g7252 [Triparma strigata]
MSTSVFSQNSPFTQSNVHHQIFSSLWRTHFPGLPPTYKNPGPLTDHILYSENLTKCFLDLSDTKPNNMSSAQSVAMASIAMTQYTTGGTNLQEAKLKIFEAINSKSNRQSSINRTIPTTRVTLHVPSLITVYSNMFPSSSQTHPLPSYLRDAPDSACAALGLAVGFMKALKYLSTSPHLNTNQLPPDAESKFSISLTSVDPLVSFSEINSDYSGKLITVKGAVLKASNPHPSLSRGEFFCPKCQTKSLDCVFRNGIYKTPSRCTSEKCPSKSFIINQIDYVDEQTLTLQSLSSSSGQVPLTLQCEVHSDLVDKCKAGDCVTIVGVVDSMNSMHRTGKAGKQAVNHSLYTLFLRGVWVGVEDGGTEGAGEGVAGSGFTIQQLRSIKSVARADCGPGIPPVVNSVGDRNAFPFDLLVNSLAPEICGHELAKAGLLLVLLSGTPNPSPNQVQTRTNPHILIVGDPGMGKSQLLKRTSELLRRSVYIGGNTSSKTGLTVSVVKDHGQTTLEAGALVLSDGGICCIDEFDKMSGGEVALLECMEQQTVSVAKSGICTSLQARCSVVAAANPAQGTYDVSKSVAENLKISAPVLSRFDLCFILQDTPDTEIDARVSEHIMRKHYKRSADQMNEVEGAGYNEPPLDPSQSSQTKYLTELSETVRRIQKHRKAPTLPMDIVRDYIAYARKFCHPKLKAKAATILKDFYIAMKYPKNPSTEPLPITTRQLESMVRLSQARAKASLRPYVTEEDARDVVDIMTQSIFGSLIDVNGELDTQRGGTTGKSKSKKKKAFLEIILKSRQDILSVAELMSMGMLCFRGDEDPNLDKTIRDIIEEFCDDGSLLRQAHILDEFLKKKYKINRM